MTLFISNKIDYSFRFNFISKKLEKLINLFAHQTIIGFSENDTLWNFNINSNGSYYVSPLISGKIRMIYKRNSCDETMECDAVGLCLTIMALEHESALNHNLYYDYKKLIEFAQSHPETSKIIKFIQMRVLSLIFYDQNDHFDSDMKQDVK